MATGWSISGGAGDATINSSGVATFPNNTGTSEITYTITYEDANGCAASTNYIIPTGTTCQPELMCEFNIPNDGYEIDTKNITKLVIEAYTFTMNGTTRVYDNTFIPNTSLLDVIDINGDDISGIKNKLQYNTSTHCFELTEKYEHGLELIQGDLAEVNVSSSQKSSWTFEYSGDFDCDQIGANVEIIEYVYPYRLVIRLEIPSLYKFDGGTHQNESYTPTTELSVNNGSSHVYDWTSLINDNEKSYSDYIIEEDKLENFIQRVQNYIGDGFNPAPGEWEAGYTLSRIEALCTGFYWSSNGGQYFCQSPGSIVASASNQTITSDRNSYSVIRMLLQACNNGFGMPISIDVYTVNN